MGRKLKDLFRAASELPETERAELAGLLLESLEGEPDEAVEVGWTEEIERRARQIDSGKVKTIPWEQVRADPSARLNGKRGTSSGCPSGTDRSYGLVSRTQRNRRSEICPRDR